MGDGQRSLTSQEGVVSSYICPGPARPDHPPLLGAGATCCLAEELQPGWPSL